MATELNIPVENEMISKGEVLELIRDLVKDNKPFAEQFEKRVIIPLFKKMGENITVSNIRINGTEIGKSLTEQIIEGTTDISEKANKALSEKVDSAIDKTQIKDIKIDTKSVKDNIQKVLSDNIKISKTTKNPIESILDRLRDSVSSKNIDSKIDLTSLLGMSTKDNILLKYKWFKLRFGLIDRLEKALKTTNISFNDKDSKNLKLSSLLGSSTSEDFFVRRTWNGFRKQVLDVIKKKVDLNSIEIDKKVTLSSLLGSPKQEDFLVTRAWNKFRKDVLKKITDSISARSLDIDKKISLSTLLGSPKEEDFFVRRTWNGFRRDILKKIMERVTSRNLDIDKKISLSTLLSSPVEEDFFIRRTWNKFRKDVLKKVMQGVSSRNLDIDKKISLSSLLGSSNSDDIFARLQWYNFRSDILKKIKKAVSSQNIKVDKNIKVTDLLGLGESKDASSFLSSVRKQFSSLLDLRAKPNQKEAGAEPKSRFKSILEEKVQDVSIVSIDDKILEKLKSSNILKGADDKKKSQSSALETANKMGLADYAVAGTIAAKLLKFLKSPFVKLGGLLTAISIGSKGFLKKLISGISSFVKFSKGLLTKLVVGISSLANIVKMSLASITKTAVGKFGLVAAAGAAGYGIGKVIDKHGLDFLHKFGLLKNTDGKISDVAGTKLGTWWNNKFGNAKDAEMAETVLAGAKARNARLTEQAKINTVTPVPAKAKEVDKPKESSQIIVTKPSKSKIEADAVKIKEEKIIKEAVKEAEIIEKSSTKKEPELVMDQNIPLLHKELKKILEALENLIHLQAAAPAQVATADQSSESLPGIVDEEIRDPAYILRSKVWANLHRGYAVT